MNPLKIVFAGTPEFGLPCLESLFKSSHELLAVYTQPDRPSGRGRKMQASAIKQWALKHDIPVYQPLHFKTEQARKELASLSPDLMVVIAYGLILPKSILDLPRFGCINVHASLLPHWRGASPIQHAILYGDTESGVTIMKMDAGMDTGDMLAISRCSVAQDETSGSLHDKLSTLSSAPLMDTLNHLTERLEEAKPQHHCLATYAPKITKEQAKIDWSQPALQIDRQIRAFNPWPIAYTNLEETTLRIHQAQIIEQICTQEPGTIIDINKAGIKVATGQYILNIKKLQRPGGKPMPISDWINAGQHQLKTGSIFQ